MLNEAPLRLPKLLTLESLGLNKKTVLQSRIEQTLIAPMRSSKSSSARSCFRKWTNLSENCFEKECPASGAGASKSAIVEYATPRDEFSTWLKIANSTKGSRLPGRKFGAAAWTGCPIALSKSAARSLVMRRRLPKAMTWTMSGCRIPDVDLSPALCERYRSRTRALMPYPKHRSSSSRWVWRSANAKARELLNLRFGRSPLRLAYRTICATISVGSSERESILNENGTRPVSTDECVYE
ncbi:uncharacterized protein PV07_03770 [Cladophialophora immunda]|uniref:Uncharacterized protein n=1 Tax=Cladophialophora immunda TaxID=569365 RepID=A0A0D2CQG6_9EURO|nr:uncharacterized protein PV07_03770 [Cladophialophora immunda]KIW32210.1 hypothetical protein PV07_03770 [Cladophialophora immunda]